MFTTFRRISMLTVAFGFAGGATALASISVSPSSVAVPEYHGFTITATSHGKPLRVTKDTCTALAGEPRVKSGSESSSQTGHPSEQVHTVTLRFPGRGHAGECAITFSDGTEHETVDVRVNKEP